jgi:dihydroorotase
MGKMAFGSITMHDLMLKGGSVLTSDGLQNADVAINDGSVVAIGKDLSEATRVIDCAGSWVGPGLVDIHTHLREPGQEWKEDIATGSAAAAAGGYTAVVAMPNTTPAVDAGHLAIAVADQGRRAGLLDVVSAGCLTLGRRGEQVAQIDELWNAGVRIFTDDGDSVANACVLRSVMERVAQLGGVVSQHAVDGPLSAAGSMHEGSVSSLLGLGGIPREADDITIARDIALARLTGARYHAQHLSTARSVELVAAAKTEGLGVTAEVSPHHLMFDHDELRSGDASFKMMPPLREPSDRRALVEGLRTGIIDVVATDHAPHAAAEKDVPFEDAAYGVIGLEWAAAVVNQVVHLGQSEFFERMSARPAQIAQLEHQGRPLEPGIAANIVVFHPSETWTPTSTVSKSQNAPYLGRELTGRVKATVFGGAITHEVGP